MLSIERLGLPFISIEQAAHMLGTIESIVKSLIAERKLTAHVRTPTLFPGKPSSIYDRPDEDFFSPPALGMFFEQPLDDRCQVKNPVFSEDGHVTCKTIIVKGTSGEAPTRNDTGLSAQDGEIGAGEITLHRGWSFPEKDILLNTDEVRRLSEANRQQAKQNQRKDPFKLIVEQEARLLRDRNEGKKPQYMQLIKHLSKLANSDDRIGAIITDIDFEAKVVILNEGEPPSFKTIRNWLSELK
ncbi:hypothetical protein [Geobacter sp.]|uniref:hypothetical protein n=1 Tax=Geobacter sp. TaxID=46610 RepID=UPI0027B93A2E|nr:hypothetical protein [Geobacter sp.]